jgi:hypothetical protein
MMASIFFMTTPGVAPAGDLQGLCHMHAPERVVLNQWLLAGDGNRAYG